MLEKIKQIDPWDVVYIAGPMTGLPDYNRKAFSDAEDAIRCHCKDILNPARHPDGWEHSRYMRHAVRDLLLSTVVVFLPGWQQSKGAKFERHMAEIMGLRILEVEA